MNIKITDYLFYIVILFTPVILWACSDDKLENEVVMNNHESSDIYYNLVKTYIAETKGWVDKTYSIELKNKENNISVYWVIHNDDLETSEPGRGKSVSVHVDTNKIEVVKELVFQ